MTFWKFDAYQDCFTSVSNGKSSIASAITDKGVSTSATAAFNTMASNIRSIPTGVDTSDATATAAQILSGYTAYAKGSKLIGTYSAHNIITCSGSVGIESSLTASASSKITFKATKALISVRHNANAAINKYIMTGMDIMTLTSSGNDIYGSANASFAHTSSASASLYTKSGTVSISYTLNSKSVSVSASANIDGSNIDPASVTVVLWD